MSAPLGHDQGRGAGDDGIVPPVGRRREDSRGYGPAMPARRDPGTKAETKLARVRMARGVTQDELADAIGISEPTYRRLERGKMKSPPLGYLVNAALALGVELDDVIEDAWRGWHKLRSDRTEVPAPEEFWRRPYRPTGPDIDELLK